MKNLLWVVIALLVLDKGCELIEKAKEYKQDPGPYRNYLWEAAPGVALPKTDPARKAIGYDWDTQSTIYADMADTMRMIGGKWIGKTHYPPLKPLVTHKAKKEPQWLRPTGRDKKQYHSAEEVRAWKQMRQAEQEMMMQRQLDEADADDRVREMVQQELDR